MRLCFVRTFGIIPARAGFTGGAAGSPGGGRDHPRSRGVYGWRMMIVLRKPWIIPARAGFTRESPGVRLPRPDHPRSRGVYRSARYAGAGMNGSSPLARGLRDSEGEDDVAAGIIPARAGFTRLPLECVAHPQIIPARAGFTRRARRGRSSRGDQPRSRGVYAAAASTEQRIGRSSPLARGLRARHQGRPG